MAKLNAHNVPVVSATQQIDMSQFDLASTGRGTKYGSPAHEVEDCAWSYYVLAH